MKFKLPKKNFKIFIKKMELKSKKKLGNICYKYLNLSRKDALKKEDVKEDK